MKKLSYLFITIISFIGISSVKADTYEASNFYYHFDDMLNAYTNYQQNIEFMVNYWEENYSSQYPYYSILYFDNIDSYHHHWLFLSCSTSNSLVFDNYSPYSIHMGGDYIITAYNISTDTYVYNKGNLPGFYINVNNVYNSYLFSNVNMIFNSNETFDKFSIPSYTNNELDISYPAYVLEDGDNFPSIIDLYNGNYERNMFDHYTEINLNNYAYVALSFKDYTLRNDNINQFSTNIYTKGQLCLTPVYDYGMKEKTEYYSGYQVDRCSVVYDDFTPVRTFILKQDLENKAIYYLKAYDTSIDNKVKVDTNIFNITYITSDNADNPSVSVNGRNYPTIAYDDLSSSSTESEEEGYVSGESTNVLDHFDDNFINNLFSSPLNILKSVWGAITSMLSLVATFIALLPSTLQGFLYMSFALAIILGIIKILL